MLYYDHRNKTNARKLRSDMTPWERKLWYCFLREYPVRFQRQKCIGSYIVDFYCFQAKLVIELDGGGHYTPEQQVYDARRDQFLREYGLEVIRFTNTDVDRSFYQVCSVIDDAVKRFVK